MLNESCGQVNSVTFGINLAFCVFCFVCNGFLKPPENEERNGLITDKIKARQKPSLTLDDLYLFIGRYICCCLINFEDQVESFNFKGINFLLCCKQKCNVFECT